MRKRKSPKHLLNTKKYQLSDCEKGVKFCIRCEEVLPLDNYWSAKKELCGKAGVCKACQHKERAYETGDDQAVRKYKVTPRYAASRRTSNCEICGVHASMAPQQTLFIDHDHNTNEVRGLLCHGCNAAIGLMVDNPARLRAAAEYLERRDAK